MPRFESPLNNIRIASPCPANWDAMYGNDRMRFCGECKLNVYNLSGMSKQEAERLIENAEGRLCVRFYRRADGTVITENCPVGWAKVKQRTRVFATAVFSMIIGIMSGLFFVSAFSRSKPIAETGELRVDPYTTPTPNYVPLMGAVAPERPTMGNVAVPTPTPKPSQPLMGETEVGKVVRKN
jgi:hypothetical protein